MNFEYAPGATPLDPDEAAGLVPKHITHQGDLNAWEQANIFQADRWAASECSPAVMHVCRHHSPAGWLLQRKAATLWRGLDFSLWELACQRMFACGDERLPARFASRLAPTKKGRNA